MTRGQRSEGWSQSVPSVSQGQRRPSGSSGRGGGYQLGAGYPLKLHFQIPCVFPVRPQIVPVPIYVTCDYYIHKTDLSDLSRFKKKKSKSSLQISQYILPLESGKLQLEQTKFPVFNVFWQNFQIPCVFPDKESFWSFSLFSLCSGYPVGDSRGEGNERWDMGYST